MSAPPEFSIVIPTFRRPAELKRCLGALASLDAEGPSFEVLVVDDGGGEVDDVAPAPPHATRVELLRRPHAGPAAARNAGARAARGRFLAFTDDDCEPRPAWLCGFADRFAEEPLSCLGGSTSHGGEFDSLGAAHQILIDFVGRNRENGASPVFFPSNNLAVPRQAFLDIGGFDERFPFAAGEDREFCARWTAGGGVLSLAPGSRVDHRHPFRLAGFVRMHLRYGRGARRFRRERARAEGRPVRLEPPSYYWRLIRAPLASPRRPGARRLVGALLVSQLAHAGGYFWEVLAELR